MRNFASGDKSVALSVSGAERWAIIHDVIQVSDHLFVAFYSAFGGVRAAVAERPQGPFSAVPGFQLAPTEDWEKAGGTPQSLESDGAHVWVREDAASLVLWLGYDSYHVDIGTGQLGWAKIAIDKNTGGVRLLEKHPRNPLALLPDRYLAARCGGNLSSDLRLAGQHVFLYYTRPTRARSFLTLALGCDPLFQNITRRVELEPALGDEKVIEKFESYFIDGTLHVIYESQLASGHWGTGMRTSSNRRLTGLRIQCGCTASPDAVWTSISVEMHRTGDIVSSRETAPSYRNSQSWSALVGRRCA